MPRPHLVLVVLLGLLALAPAAGAATRNQILRDCEDDSRLSGSYTNAELRDARNNINSGLDAYSDCRDVLSAAIAAGARARLKSGGKSGGGGADGGGGTGGVGGVGSPSIPSVRDGAPMPGTLGTAPEAGPPEVSPRERRELRTARERLPEVEVRGQRVVPGVQGVAGKAAGTTLPTSLLIPLILLALAALGAGVPLVRRRVLARRSA